MKKVVAPRGALRFLSSQVLLLAAACGEVAVPAPTLNAIEPATTVVGVEVAVTLTGHDFNAAVQIDFSDQNNSQVSYDYEVLVGDTLLLEIERVDSETLTAIVPATLAVGTYDVIVSNDADAGDSLPAAFTVVPGSDDADGDGVPDSVDECPGFDDTIDSDGDGTPDGCDTICPTDWHDCNWGSRIQLTVNTGQVDVPQSGFPVYVDLALLGAGFFGAANNDGSDILVTDGDGVAVLPRELELFDHGATRGALWFNAPDVRDGSTFYVYFGNASASETDSAAVWDTDFLGVWHNSNDPTASTPQVTDSTGNGVDGDVRGNMPANAQVAGKLGNCLDFDGQDDHVRLDGSDGVLDHTGSGAGMAMTICAWVNPDGLTGSFPSIVSKGDTQYHLKLHSTDRWEFKSGSQWHLSDDPIAAPFTQWYHVCGVNDGSNNIIYVNGILQADSSSPTAILHDDYPVWMGLDSQNIGRDPFDGFIDEVKFSATARDAGWIGAEFNNQNDPAAFFVVGPVEAP